MNVSPGTRRRPTARGSWDRRTYTIIIAALRLVTRDHNCEDSDARTGARCGVELETKVFVVRTVILDIHAEVLVLGAGTGDTSGGVPAGGGWWTLDTAA